MPRPLTDADDRSRAEARRVVLCAAIEATGTSQSWLHRQVAEHDKVALTTIGAWCRGRRPVGELELRGLLSFMGLPPTWSPATGLPPNWKRPPEPYGFTVSDLPKKPS